MRKLKIFITGGGIAGAFSAYLLGRDGHEVHVIERRKPNPAGQVANVSGRTGNFTLSDRGRKSLEAAGLLDGAMRFALPLDGRMVHLPYAPFTMFSPYGGFQEDILHSISRSDLQSLLLNEAMKVATFHFGDTLVDVDPFKKSAAFASDPGGVWRGDFDLFIGADGVQSATRMLLEERGWLTVERLPSDWCYTEESAPIKVKPEHMRFLQVWPHQNSVTCGLPMQDGSLLLNHLIRKQDLAPTDKPVYHIERLKVDPWYVGESTILIGDAAHSMSPFMGQGMNMALEDSLALARILRQSRDLDAAALWTFQETRQRIANALIERSEEHSITLARRLLNPLYVVGQHAQALSRKAFPEIFGRSEYNSWTRASIS